MNETLPKQSVNLVLLKIHTAGALAVARARQENKPGWVKKFFAKKR